MSDQPVSPEGEAFLHLGPSMNPVLQSLDSLTVVPYGDRVPPIEEAIPDDGAFELMLLLARRGLTDDVVAQARGLVEGDLDWQRFGDVASAHGTVLLVYPHVHQYLKGAMPRDVLRGIQSRYHLLRIHCEVRTAGLLRVLGALEAAGVDALTFKGPALATQAYGELGAREYNDVDILIHPEHIARADAALGDLGYRQDAWPWAADGLPGATLRALGKDLGYLGADERVPVDLHWRLTDPGLLAPPSLSAAWDRRAMLSVNGQDVATLNREDALLAAVTHGASHMWARLKWLCDVAELMRGDVALDWERILRDARATESMRSLHVATLLAHELLGARAPDGLIDEARADGVARGLALRVRLRLMSSADMPSEGELRAFRRASRATSTARSRDLLARLVQGALPTSRDWEFVALPSWLFGLYGLLRPVRLMRDAINARRE